LSLLWAYLGRIDLGSEELNKEKLGVAPPAWQLNDAFQVIMQAFSITKPLIASYRTSQCLIQAISPDGPPLLQLPFFTPKVIEAIESGRVRHHYTVQDYMDIDEDERKELTVGPGLLTEQQYQVAINTAQQFPYINLEKFWFKVEGEKVITPNSLVQLVVKFRFFPPGVTDFPVVSDEDLEDPDGDEPTDKKEYAPPLAHAPFFARDHSPKWQMFLGQPKNARIAVPPTTYTTFDKPILTEDGEPTFNVQTMRMTFGAPPEVGEYTFAMHILNDSYLGFDITEYITLNVEDPSNAEVIEDDGEISEPGEGIHT
jgi:translocation protein SEC63